MDMSEAERTFEIGAKDPQSWLNQAKQLKMSADVIEAELRNEIPVMLLTIGTNERFLALMKSFMMLNAMAIENLMKGILIGRNPSLVTHESMSATILPRGGHGISRRANEICAFDDSQVNLLKRLEEFLFWAGRYLMPLKSTVYRNSLAPEMLLTFNESDFETVDDIYNRMVSVLEDEWRVSKRS